MKKHKLLFLSLMLISVMFLGGWYQNQTGGVIKNDGKIDFVIYEKMDYEKLVKDGKISTEGAKSSVSKLTDKKVKEHKGLMMAFLMEQGGSSELQKNNSLKELFKRDDMEMSYKREGLVVTASYEVRNLSETQLNTILKYIYAPKTNNTVFTLKENGDNMYGNLKVAASERIEGVQGIPQALEEYFNSYFVIKIPTPVKSHNATYVSDDKMNLSWEIPMDNKKDIKLTFSYKKVNSTAVNTGSNTTNSNNETNDTSSNKTNDTNTVENNKSESNTSNDSTTSNNNKISDLIGKISKPLSGTQNNEEQSSDKKEDTTNVEKVTDSEKNTTEDNNKSEESANPKEKNTTSETKVEKEKTTKESSVKKSTNVQNTESNNNLILTILFGLLLLMILVSGILVIVKILKK